MDFKFTKVKVILSSLISLVVGFILSFQGFIIGGANSDWTPPKIIVFFFGFLISFIITYLVYSVFQNREGESKLSKIATIVLRILILLGVIYLFFYLQTPIF